MPLFNHPTLGDIQSYEYRTGTITSIDNDLDTCMVDSSGTILFALIFYH
ncbi:MAG: hypothetical protein ACOYOS_00185 [Syntrophales bacterium]